MAEHLRTELVHDALTMALDRRGLGKRSTATDVRAELPGAGGEDLLHQSDRGVQYASDAYQTLLARHGITCSMSAKGNCYDNAAMESFWATLKTELVQHQRSATRAQAKTSIFEYIDVFYNRKRLHGALGYQSPETFEARLN